MNEQELFLKVGDLATRAGCPVPSIRLIDDPNRLYVVLKPQGVVGPVLEVRSDVGEIPVGRLDFLIAQDLVAYSLGAFGYYRRIKWVFWSVMGLVSLVLGVRLGWWAYVLSIVAWVMLGIAVSAVSTRVFLRRVDRGLAEVLGRSGLEGALQEVADAGCCSRGVRWFLQGAIPMPPERLSWLRNA